MKRSTYVDNDTINIGAHYGIRTNTTEDVEETKRRKRRKEEKRKRGQAMDFLKQDAPIRGQNYVCVSFVSPENIIRSRDVFDMCAFVKDLGKDVTELFDTIERTASPSSPSSPSSPFLPFSGAAQGESEGENRSTATTTSTHLLHVKETLALLKERHAYLTDEEEMQQQLELFRCKQADRLQKDFQATHGSHTSLRGFKIRGVHDSLEEARLNAQAINRVDPTHGVFVASMGSWCAWSPSVPPEDSISTETETDLNTLVRIYLDKIRQAHELYERRKNEKVEAAKKVHDQTATVTSSPSPSSL